MRRWRGWRRWQVVVVVGFLLLATVVGSTQLRVPYFSISPGSAPEVNELIAVGRDGPHHPADGRVLFTTVALRRATILEALRGWIDPETEVVAEEAILGDTPPDRLRIINLALMDQSKQTALVVAFRHLGYDVDASGRGALVTAIDPSRPAEGRLEPGDVIEAVDGRPVEFAEDVVDMVGRREPGDVVRLTVVSALDERDGEDGAEREVTVPLEARDDGSPVMGVLVQTRDLEYDFPFEVTIDSGRVGGPSAGLAFALAVIDELTPGELTGGRVVAVTGTIDVEGRIGPVGGIAQKVVAARRAGAEVFIVPASEEADARAHAGPLTVVPAGTLDEALEELAALGGDDLPPTVAAGP